MSIKPEVMCPCCGLPTKIVKGREYRIGRNWVPERACSECTVRGAKPHMERRAPSPAVKALVEAAYNEVKYHNEYTYDELAKALAAVEREIGGQS